MKKFFSIVLLLCMCCTFYVTLNVFAETVASGNCGDNLTWKIDDEGTLTIDGYGQMKNWITYKSVPWYSDSSDIKRVVISNGVTSIGDYAFYECKNLISATIPESITDIRNSAFFGCRSLTSIVIPDGVTRIWDSAFYGCSGLKSINLPNSVRHIFSNAFMSCTGLTSVTIPEGVTHIGYYAFDWCVGLTNITIPSSVTSVGNYAFKACTGLTNVIIQNGVTEIGRNAFEGCTNLMNVEIPCSITSIGVSAFSDCKSLETIHYSGSKSQWEAITIGSGNSELNNIEVIYLTEDENNESIVCYICETEIATDNVIYDENNQPLCQQCADEISENEEQYIELECPHCSKILEITKDEYNERESIVCLDCMKFIVYNGEDTEYECFDCGETFYYSDTKVVENGKIYCPYCNCIVDGDFMETCYICGKLFYEDELISDEDDYLICHNCYDELQNEDEELFYIQCPYCEEAFEDDEDIYDEDGYAICPYCDECIDNSEEIPEENEIKFATSDWAAEEVYEAYQNNLIPDEMLETALYKTISREEFAAVAVKLYENIIGEIPDVDIYDTPFTDCNYASEYNNYIAVAYELGITKGTSDTTFSPYENITREQLATMLSRVALPPDNRSVSQFADHNKISQYAIDAVYLMAMHDIIKGVGNNRFAPKETATKEQAIIIASRIYNSYNEW